jgi:hypothetical protein
MKTVETTLCDCGRELAGGQWQCGLCHARQEWGALIERRRILTAAIDDLLEQRETLTGQIDNLHGHIIAVQLNN